MDKKRLEELYKAASMDQGSTNLDGTGYKARMRLGVKISKDTLSKEVKIYDYSSGGNYYVEMKEEHLSTLNKLGWTNGVLKLTLDKYKNKLETIKKSIARELNGNNSSKRLNYYKEARQQVLKKYYRITQKLTKNET